jgi:hypothetical protein
LSGYPGAVRLRYATLTFGVLALSMPSDIEVDQGFVFFTIFPVQLA